MALPAVNGEVDVKTAWIPGFDGFAIKVSPGFFDNPRPACRRLNGLMILFSATTGLVEALFLDNGYLTDVRTAAAGAVAARHMAPATVETAGVLGTGVQARLQLQAAHLVRPFGRALVWGRDPAKAAATAADLAATLGIEARAEPDPARLVADEPARRHHHARPRTRSCRPTGSIPACTSPPWAPTSREKNELDPAILAAADLYVCDRVSPGRGPRRAPLRARRRPLDPRHPARARRGRLRRCPRPPARGRRSPSAT